MTPSEELCEACKKWITEDPIGNAYTLKAQNRSLKLHHAELAALQAKLKLVHDNDLVVAPDYYALKARLAEAEELLRAASQDQYTNAPEWFRDVHAFLSRSARSDAGSPRPTGEESGQASGSATTRAGTRAETP